MVDEEKLKKAKAAAAPFIEAARQDFVNFVFNFKRQEEWAVLTSEREADTLTLLWESARGKHHNFCVTVVVYEINLHRDPGITPLQIIHSNNIVGGVKLKLQEGDSYLISCMFYEEGKINEFLLILFHLGIPLSPERKALLKKALSMDQNPDETVKHEFKTLFKKEDAFEEEYANGIKRIKSKKLRPKDEKIQIKEFQEKIELMKEKFGI